MHCRATALTAVRATTLRRRPGLDSSFVLPSAAALVDAASPDEDRLDLDVVDVRDRDLERIAVDHDQVRLLARLDRTKPVGDAEPFCGVDREEIDGLAHGDRLA